MSMVEGEPLRARESGLFAAEAHQNEAGNGVGCEVLRSKAYGHAAHAADRQQRLDVEPKCMQPASTRWPL